ncbi:hypothetical protein GCM10007913_18030 [Devosia yakushimensis]|uniref:Uncharacterized protein n=1 Tax=Devosia yakushimensis TaxID=470028 RepID=A0ABQ5UDB2_9HYPH|nr:hypothetical protein GCM10007913_18030 [Devosia yakushimensis]
MDDAERDQFTHGLSHHGLADAKGGGQARLGRQWVTDFQPAIENCLTQPLKHHPSEAHGSRLGAG